MRLLYTAPRHSSYNDNTTWFPTPIGRGALDADGFWLAPGEKVFGLTKQDVDTLIMEFEGFSGTSDRVVEHQKRVAEIMRKLKEK